MANSVAITADWDLRACDKQAVVIIERCNPTAAQKPAAAQGSTMSVKRHIRCVSELTIRHRGQSELGVQTHVPRLHCINRDQPPREENAVITLSPPSVLLSVVALAAACNSGITKRACCHCLPIYVPDHHHAASLLFGQCCRDCIWCACYRSHCKICVQV